MRQQVESSKERRVTFWSAKMLIAPPNKADSTSPLYSYSMRVKPAQAASYGSCGPNARAL